MPAHTAAPTRRPQPVLSRTAIVHVIAVLCAVLVKLGAGDVSAWLDGHSDLIAGGVLLVSPFVSAFLAARKVTPLSAPQSADGTPLVPDPGALSVRTVAADVEAALEAAAAIHPAGDAGFLTVGGSLLAGLVLAGGMLTGALVAVLVVLAGALVVAIVRGARVPRGVRPAASPLRTMPAGTIGVTPSHGLVAWLVRTVTRGPVAHAFLATGDGDLVIEGDPHGARFNHASRYATVYWLTNLSAGMTYAQREAAVEWARERIGTPYSWLDDLSIGLVDLFGWAPAALRRRLVSSDTLMCSQLCDAALEAGGRVLFTDGRPAGGVSPNDLYRLNYTERERVAAPSLLVGGFRARGGLVPA